jgi:folate-binding protein YgfZ
MSSEWNSVALDSLGVLRAHGADVISFLQGQLSNDMKLLGPEQALLAGFHNPQGRVIALLHLLERGSGEVLAILPRELIAGVTARLRKFVLRAKVSLDDESALWRVAGLIGPSQLSHGVPPLALPQAAGGVARTAESFIVRIADSPARWLLLAPAGAAATHAAVASAPQYWQRLTVACGEPQVYAATSEQFVAQMLNLDALGAIAFDKGCYTGQEVIARAHYRGRVKRRLQRFVTRGAARLRPGDSGELADGRTFAVVSAVELDDGRCEFLAVAPLTPTAGGSATGSHGSAMSLAAEQLPLPYPLPQ